MAENARNSVFSIKQGAVQCVTCTNNITLSNQHRHRHRRTSVSNVLRNFRKWKVTVPSPPPPLTRQGRLPDRGGGGGTHGVFTPGHGLPKKRSGAFGSETATVNCASITSLWSPEKGGRVPRPFPRCRVPNTRIPRGLRPPDGRSLFFCVFQSGISPDGWVLRGGGSVSEKLWQAHVSKKRVTPWYLRARGKIVSEWQHQEFGNRHTETPPPLPQCRVPNTRIPRGLRPPDGKSARRVNNRSLGIATLRHHAKFHVINCPSTLNSWFPTTSH